MSAAVETMAYAGETPWHGLGVKVSNNLSPAQMLDKAGLNWTVSKRDMFLADGSTQVPGHYALTRDTDEKVFDVVGATWKPVQNEDAMAFFAKFVKAGKMKMETAGSLQGGRHIWGLAKVGSDFSLGSGDQADEVTSHLLMSSPHLLGKALQIKFTPIRVVCMNTLAVALGKSIRGAQLGAFRMPHSVEFDDTVKANAEQALGLAVAQMEEFEGAAKLLSKKRAKEADVMEFFGDVVAPWVKNKKAVEEGEAERVQKYIPMFADALVKGPGSQLNSAKGTWWGALNAVTYVFDHEAGKERDTALNSAWFGFKANAKEKALELAIARAS